MWKYHVIFLHGSICILQVAMLICAGFLIAWIPYAVVSVVSAFGDPDSVPIPVSVVPTLLAKSSAMYNPIIYQVIDCKKNCAKSSCFQAWRKKKHYKTSRYVQRSNSRGMRDKLASDHIFNICTSLVELVTQICWKCTHPQAIQDLFLPLNRVREIHHYITCSPIGPL